MKMLCRVKLSEHRYKTPEGYLYCKDAIIARTGKQTYLKSEVYEDCSPDECNEYVEVDRTEDEVFDEKTMASFENAPLTIEHPSESVNPENYKELSVGHVQNIRKGEYEGQPVMMADILVNDAEAIELIESGEMRELSCGYDCDITEGPNPEQINIRGNHVALCERGRAGIAMIQDSMKDKIDEGRLNSIINYHYHTDKHNDMNMNEFMNRLLSEYVPNDLSRQPSNDEKEFIKEKTKILLGDGWIKPVVKDSISKGSLIQEFGKQGKQYKISKIVGNVIYAESLETGKIILFKKDEENVEWASITKSEVKDSINWESSYDFEPRKDIIDAYEQFNIFIENMSPEQAKEYCRVYGVRGKKRPDGIVIFGARPNIEDLLGDFVGEEKRIHRILEEGWYSTPDFDQEFGKALKTDKNPLFAIFVKKDGEWKVFGGTNNKEIDRESFLKKYDDVKVVENKDLDKIKKELNKQIEDSKPYFIIALSGGRDESTWLDDNDRPTNKFENARQFDSYEEADSYRKTYCKGSVQKIGDSLVIDSKLTKEEVKEVEKLLENIEYEEPIRYDDELKVIDIFFFDKKELRKAGRKLVSLYDLELTEDPYELSITLYDKYDTQRGIKLNFDDSEEKYRVRSFSYARGRDFIICEDEDFNSAKDIYDQYVEGCKNQNMNTSFPTDYLIYLEEDKDDGKVVEYCQVNRKGKIIKDSEEKWLGIDLLRGVQSKEFKNYLRDRGFYFEPSSNGDYVHFEIKNGDEFCKQRADDIREHWGKFQDSYSRRFYSKAIKALKNKLDKLDRNELLDQNQEDYEVQKNKMKLSIKNQIEEYEKKLNE